MPLTIAILREMLADRYPALGFIANTIKIAVNQEFVGDDYELHDGDEVALIPPVSGGA